MQFFKVVSSFWSKLGSQNIDPLDLEIKFKDNLPVDLLYNAQVLRQLKGLISDETAMSLMPFIDDPVNELKKLKEQATDELQKLNEELAQSQTQREFNNGDQEQIGQIAITE